MTTIGKELRCSLFCSCFSLWLAATIPGRRAFELFYFKGTDEKYSFALEDLKDLLIRSGNLDIISTDVSSRIKRNI